MQLEFHQLERRWERLRVDNPQRRLRLGTVRSLAYFPPVIEEVLNLRVSPDYFDYLRRKLTRNAIP